MKDTSRPHPTPSTRPAPYKKRNASGNGSPTRGTRRPYDTSHCPQLRVPGNLREIVSPPNRANRSRRDEAPPSRTVLDFSADDEHRKKGGNRATSNTRRYTSMDRSARERPPHRDTSTLGIYADLPGPSLRLPLTSASTTTNTSTGQRKVEDLPSGSVSSFLRSIKLPDSDNPPSAPPIKESLSLSTTLRTCPPPLSTDNAIKAACTNGGGYQVSLVYKGYPFSYDLSALPDDPKGTVALLNITKSDPGAYFLVSAHYRRTGRPRAACAVIRSLLDNLDNLTNVEKGKGDVVPIPVSATSTATLVSPGSPCPKSSNYTRPVFQNAAIRPAMLLLAACELDISRERPDDPEGARHATIAHDLFRAVYGTVNDDIVAGAVRPGPNNTLTLDFSSKRNCLWSSQSDSNSHLPSSVPPPDAESLSHVKELEKELSSAHAGQKKLQEKLSTSNDRLTRTEDRVHVLESHSREVLVQLDASRDENWELRRRLAESEQRARELVRCTPSADNRVLERLKDLWFDDLEGGVRSM